MNNVIIEHLKQYNNIETTVNLKDNSQNGERAERIVLCTFNSLGLDANLDMNTSGSSDINFHPRGHSGISFGVNVKSTYGPKLKDKKYWRYSIDLKSGDGHGNKKLAKDCLILAVYFHDIDFLILLDTTKLNNDSLNISISSEFPDCEIRPDTNSKRDKIIEMINLNFSKYYINMSKFLDIELINKAKELFL